MIDPLAPTSSAASRLILAAAMIALVWMGVIWAVQ